METGPYLPPQLSPPRPRWFLWSCAVGGLALQSATLSGCGGSSHPSTSTTTSTTTTTTSTDSSAPRNCKRPTGNTCEECEAGFDLQHGECWYSCQSDLPGIKVVSPSLKGLCLDDTTFSDCPDRVPHLWPNSKEPLGSVRLFAAWKREWPAEHRGRAWQVLVDQVKSHQMKVMVGTQVTCNETDDDQDWELVLEFLKLLGSDNIMTVAIGNEMDLYFMKANVTAECTASLWSGGYYWRKTVERISDLDALGGSFATLPVTTVFSGFSLGGEPFYETPQAMCLSYLKNATALYQSRWTFTLNVYPYLDPGDNMDPGGTTCNGAIARCTCFDQGSCLAIGIISAMRTKMKALTGSKEDKLIIGEIGWSTPTATTLSTPVKDCDAFSSPESFKKSYFNFLSWDLSLPMLDEDGETVSPPDHVFYFTMRDSVNFGDKEYFGLVPQCSDTKCKLQGSSVLATNGAKAVVVV